MRTLRTETPIRTNRREASVGRRSGFTLVELLVVIAIIAVLLTLIVPALSRAKAQAREVLCKSRLRQFALSLTYYADDYDQKLPTQGNLVDLACWDWDGLRRTGPTDVLLNEYVDGQMETFFCPSFAIGGSYSAGQNLLHWYEYRNEAGERTGWYWSRRQLGYSSFMSEALPERWHVTKLGSKERPLIMDTIKSYDANQYFDYMLHHWDAKEGRPRGANMAYTDTHVEWHDYAAMEPQWGYSTRLYYWYSETSSDLNYPPSAAP